MPRPGRAIHPRRRFRQPQLDSAAAQIRHARELLARPENAIASIARLLGVSRSTIYKHIPEAAGGRLTIQTIATVPTRSPGRTG
jgi:DNA-binding phage protein